MAKRRPRIGTLRHLVQIQEGGETQGADGARVLAWTTIESVRAAVEPMSGREFLLADQTRANVTHQITMRTPRRLALTPRHRIRWLDGTRERLFNITTITNPDELQRFTTALAREEV